MTGCCGYCQCKCVASYRKSIIFHILTDMLQFKYTVHVNVANNNGKTIKFYTLSIVMFIESELHLLASSYSEKYSVLW